MPSRVCLRGERGGISAEYMGLVALAAAVVFALVSAPVGQTIADEVERLVCEIAHGGECPAEAVDPECLLASSTRTAGMEVTVGIFTVGGGATLIKEVYADGRTVFTLVDDAEVAAELIAGVRARAGRIGFNAAASASAGGRLEGARVFEFGDADAARAFEARVRNEGTVRDLLHQAAEGDGILGGILGGPLAGLDPLGIKDGIADLVFGEDADDLPAPTATYIDVEAFVDGDASLAAGIPGLDVELDGAAEAAGGAKVLTSGPEAGNVELHYELSAEAAGDLGILAMGPGVGGDAKVTVTMILDNQGDNVFRPTRLKVSATAGYTGSPLNVTDIVHQADLAGLTRAIERASAGSTDGTGRQIELTGELDLTDPENLAAAVGLLGGGVGGVPALVQRLDEDGRLTFQTYETSASETGAEIAVGLGVGGGGGFDSSSDTQDLTSALVRDPGGGWTPRRCGLVPD